MPLSPDELRHCEPGTAVMIDGFQQLRYWSRLRLKRICRRQQLGLLVTAHRSVGLPLLYSTSTSLELAQQLARDLLREDASCISSGEVAASFARQRGNLREVFFELYDLYEMRRAR
jgi:hypothetical protein